MQALEHNRRRGRQAEGEGKVGQEGSTSVHGDWPRPRIPWNRIRSWSFLLSSRFVEINETPSWKALEQHQRALAPVQMRDLFAKEPGRFERFSLRLGDLLLDFSKNRI